MGTTYPGRNMWVALGIQTTLTNVATVFTFMQPTEIGGFLEDFTNIDTNRRLGTRFQGMSFVGTKTVPFSFTVEATPSDLPRILAAGMGVGTMATQTSGYMHTFRFNESLPYCSLYGYLSGVADATANATAMRLTGGKISKLVIKGGIDDIMTVAVEGIAMTASAVSVVSAGTVVFSSDNPWFLNGALGTGTISIGSTITLAATFGEARQFELTIDNKVTADQRIHGSATPVGMAEGSSEVVGKMTVVYNPQTYTEINNYAAGNNRALTLTVTGQPVMAAGGYRTLVVGLDTIRFSDDPPTYDPDVITIDLPFEAQISTASVASSYLAILNDKSLPYSSAT